MKVQRKHLYVAGAVAAGLLVVWWLRRGSSTSTSKPPAVAGTITSGSQSLTIDTNVESETFGLVVPFPDS